MNDRATAEYLTSTQWDFLEMLMKSGWNFLPLNGNEYIKIEWVDFPPTEMMLDIILLIDGVVKYQWRIGRYLANSNQYLEHNLRMTLRDLWDEVNGNK